MSGAVARTAGLKRSRCPTWPMRFRLCARPNQFVGFRQRRGQRLFDQHINPGFHQGPRSLKVADRGNSDGGGLHFAVRGHQLLDRPESAAAEFAGDGVGPGHIGIHHSHQADRFALLRQLVIDAGVVASKGAHADHSHVNKVVSQLVNSPGTRIFFATFAASFANSAVKSS